MNIELKNIFTKEYEELFKKILKHEYTHYMLKGGRGCLKSSFIAFSIVFLIMSKEGLNAVVYRKVGSTLRDSVFAQVIWSISKLNLMHLFKLKTAPMEITFLPNKNKILFKGLDKADKQKGITVERGRIGVVWFEELDQFNGMEQIRSVLQSCIRADGDNYIFYSFNPPVSKNNWANEESNTIRDDRIIYSSNYLNVPKEWLGEQFFIEAEELKKRNLRAYKNEYLGEATGSGGDVFENLELREITDSEIEKMDNFHYGLDFGFSIDPSAFSCTNFHNNKLYFISEIYEQKLKSSDLAAKIKNLKVEHEKIIADSEAPQSIAELKEYNLNVTGAKKGKGSRDAGYKWLQSLDSIVIDKRRTPNAFNEFVGKEYERNREGQFISSYPDGNDHLIDATRYAYEPEIRRRKTGNLSKQKL